MARLRKEKGQRASSKHRSMQASQADLHLLKGVDENAVSGTANDDPTLTTDVSKFLNDLTIRGKGKEKEHAPQSSKEKSAAMATAEPKIKLPTKVSFNPKSNFIFQPTSQWYAALPPLAALPQTAPTISATRLAELLSKAAGLHDADTRTFQTSSSANSSSSEASFLSKIIQSGTLSDRLSALTLLVQSSPLHNTKALENLKGMAERGKGKGGREESLKALRCIVDWWVGGGAPGQKLKYFRDQPLLHPSTTDEHLLVWYFEDWLKKYFFSILQILETLSLDPLPYIRTQTLTLLSTLLRSTPEQEQNLLRLLVNKLGDTEKALCSRASYHLLQLLQTHPAMKGVVVREVIGLVLRPAAGSSASTTAAGSGPEAKGKHIRFAEDTKPQPKPSEKDKNKEKKGLNTHARYYATVTFNQIVLTPSTTDRSVALSLLDVYFEMFKELLGEGAESVDDDVDAEVRAEEDGEEEVKTDKKGRIMIRGKGKGKGKKKIEIKGAAGFTEVEDSQSKLISAILTGVNRALPFAKVDSDDAGIKKHIDTLFLITHTSTFNISLQALMLIQQITSSLASSSITTTASSSSKSKSSTAATAKSITDRYYRTLYASLHDTRLASSSKQAMYLNLFFKSVKTAAGGVVPSSIATSGEDEDSERVKALIRRFVQVLVSGGGGATEFIAGGLYLLGELFSSIPGLRSMINHPPPEVKADTEEVYDPRKRDPQYAHAGASPLWELTPLLNHYHPAISLHARQLLSSQPLTASADLSQNTLSHFLDRFVYKNPKKLGKGKHDDDEGEDADRQGQSQGKGGSAMQPAASAMEGVKLIKGEAGRGDEEVVNEKAFLRKKRGDVPVDQIFYHEYFTRKHEKEMGLAAKAKKRKEGKEESDDEEDDDVEGDEEEEENVSGDEVGKKAASDSDEEGSDLEEEEIWKAMQSTMPKANGDDDIVDDSDASMDEDEDEENDDDDSELSMVEASDNEDLVSLDGDIPDGLIEYDGSDASDSDNPEAEEWGGIGSTGTKRKRDEAVKGGRKKLRSLPTFASYEDYAKLIEDGPEDDI